VAYVEQVQHVTPAIIEGVAVELELETQPFLISTAAMGGGQGVRSAERDPLNLLTAFNGDPNERRDR
jgi:hypothetical protein